MTSRLLMLMIMMLGVFIQSSVAINCYQCYNCNEPTFQTCTGGDVCLTILSEAGMFRVLTPMLITFHLSSNYHNVPKGTVIPPCSHAARGVVAQLTSPKMFLILPISNTHHLSISLYDICIVCTVQMLTFKQRRTTTKMLLYPRF